MPDVWISDPTWERLQQHARFLGGTLDVVLDRAIDALDQVTGCDTKPKASEGVITPTDPPRRILPPRQCRRIVIETLHELGGAATRAVLREAIEQKLKPLLTDKDYEPIDSGGPRWWYDVVYRGCLYIVREGLLKVDTPRDSYELSAAGRDVARRQAY
ncbi:hypothetical protein [Methylobacterium tarhaniae]|uniref:hypothetical protein n=1 Tax=Methylobacterium tarhaniae TaxID=1187852 RepID=UPI003CFD5AFD